MFSLNHASLSPEKLPWNLFECCRRNVLAGCIPEPASCFSPWLPRLPPIPPSAGPPLSLQPSAGDGWEQPAALSRSTGPACPVFQGAKSPPCLHPQGLPQPLSPASARPVSAVLHQGSGLCSKSFVSSFNPSRCPVQSSSGPVPGLALL